MNNIQYCLSILKVYMMNGWWLYNTVNVLNASEQYT